METRKARIAHLAGPTATIQNTPPLVTSNKARALFGLPSLTGPDGTPAPYDVLRAQRLAAPVTAYIEQFSAHPLESDAAALYGPPDGYLNGDGVFHEQRTGEGDRPVYRVELRPEDGLYPLPYMARQADGSAWEQESAFPGAPGQRSRQGFFPDGSRSFEEIDRLGIGEDGTGNLISSQADVTFYRVLPPAGYTSGDPPERRGVDFFAYKPYHLSSHSPRQGLAKSVNAATDILNSGDHDGAIWTEGSPNIEDSMYWFNLLVDTTLPICGNAAQRPHGQLSNDGPKNIVDSVRYIASREWADESGRNRAGVVLIAEERIFSARTVAKIDARPGGYTSTGGHGGILGAAGHDGPPILQYLPTAKHTYLSEVNLTRLPGEAWGVRQTADCIVRVPVRIKDDAGHLLGSAIPKVSIIKDGGYNSDAESDGFEDDGDLITLIARMLEAAPLSGIVVEGLTPYGTMTSGKRQTLTVRAVYSGLPVVRVGRGHTEGFARFAPPFISGSNLTSTKARLLLMASLMKLGALPTAADPLHPTPAEVAATRERVAEFQRLFDTH
jgi:L-asparaginase